MEDALRSVPLFADLIEEDLVRLARSASAASLPAGETLFNEGDEGDHAYVITEGQIEILRIADRRELLLAVIGEGAVVGEMALLTAAPRNATARARDDSSLIRIPKAALDDLLESSPTAARALFQVYLHRWQDTDQQLRQAERLAQLGTLSAGLAHELNNPAAAVARSAAQLSEGLTAYDDARAQLLADGFKAEQQRVLDGVLNAASNRDAIALSALERSDLEDELADWLQEAGIKDSWEIAPALVDGDYTLDTLRDLEQTLPAAQLPGALRALTRGTAVRRAVAEIEEGARRLSEIVGAMKSYSYMDRGERQRVNLTRGIDDTLTILKRKLDGIQVVREYEAALPEIEAFGGELNQVWTNLIDNASDAIREAGAADGRITIRATLADEMVNIQIEDTGAGIAPEIQQRIFDSFFTTKPVGVGSGLGLDISYRIVVQQHQGSLRLLSSEPGRTVFQVELPIQVTEPGKTAMSNR